MRYAKIVAIFAVVFSLGACATPPTKQQTGAVVGGLLGGALGSQIGDGRGKTLATIGGALLGAYAGSEFGRYMDQTDLMKVNQALETNPTNHTTAWRNPDSGYRYAVTPKRTYTSSGKVCRAYTTNVNMGGKMETVKGTACRDSNGVWRV